MNSIMRSSAFGEDGVQPTSARLARRLPSVYCSAPSGRVVAGVVHTLGCFLARRCPHAVGDSHRTLCARPCAVALSAHHVAR